MKLDPRHVELLARALGLEGCSHQMTPGHKECPEAELADGIERNEAAAQEELQKFLCSRMPSKDRKGSAKFKGEVSTISIPTLTLTLVSTRASSSSLGPWAPRPSTRSLTASTHTPGCLRPRPPARCTCGTLAKNFVKPFFEEFFCKVRPGRRPRPRSWPP